MKKIFFLVIAAIFLASCGSSAQPINIINPDAEYRYFFGASCPHCQQLNRDATEINLYSRISIEKREVYGNEENRQMFLDLIAELGIDDSGVPFVYDTVT
jgi:Zn ribbon nucleic-acid-binding protein